MLNIRPITTMKLFDAESILASQVANSVIIDLRQIAQNGYFSIFYTITGSGTIKLEYNLAAERGGTFVEPAAASDIGNTLAVGSGLKGFTPELAPFMKIKATEDGTSNTAILTAWINIQ